MGGNFEMANTVETMLDESFCVFLEYAICEAFKHSNNNQIKGFWCDGILLNQSEYTYSQQFVNNNRQVTLKAFIGKDGQTEYELILRFGRKALSRYARSLDIKECVPSPESSNFFDINTQYKRIEVQLY